MDVIDYRGVLRRWNVLIIAGTLVAALIGYRIALRNREAAHPLYAATAGVVVHYVTPPGVPYIPTLSLHTQTDVLSARVQDPGVLSGVAGRAHVALAQVQRVRTAVDPQKPLITIQVLGTTPRAAAAVAQGLAQYLAGVETQQVQAQVASLSRTAARAMAQAQQHWLEAQAYYYSVCNCLAGQHQTQPRKPPTAQRTARPLSTRPAARLTRRPRQQLSRQPPPRLTRQAHQQLSRRPAPRRTGRPPRSLSERPAPRLIRQPRRSPAAAQHAATATAQPTATTVAQHTAGAAAHPTATVVAGNSSAGSHRHATPDSRHATPDSRHRRPAHGQRPGSRDSHGSSSAGSHRRSPTATDGHRGRAANGRSRGAPGGHHGRRQQRTRQPAPQLSRRRPPSVSRRPAPRLIRQPRRSPAAAQQTATAMAHQTATAVAQQTASAAAQQQQMATAVAQQTIAVAAQQAATAAAQQQQMATAVAQQTAIAAADQAATAVAQQTATAADQQTAIAAAEQTATVVAQQTATAAAQQTATAVAQQTAIAADQQTATAAAQQTAIAAAHKTATAVAQQTATAADQQTAIAAAEQTATAAAEQTAIVAAEQTAIAAAEQTAIVAAEQTAIVAAEQTAIAAAEQTAIAAEQTPTVEPGDPDIATLSPHTQTDLLSARVQDPGVLSGVAGRAHVALAQVQRVRTAVEPQKPLIALQEKPLITLQVLGTTPRAAAAVAQGMARYLARVETQQVQVQVASLSRTAASAMARAQQRWPLVCNCLAGRHQAQLRKPPPPQRTARPLRTRPPQQLHRQPADPATLAQLRAELDLLQADYLAAASRYAALQNNPVPVATVLPGSVSAVQAPAASPLTTVLLATVVGLIVSTGLAMLLDSRRSGLPALARARGLGHAASLLPDPPFASAKGGSGSARRAHAALRDPEPAATLTPGSARPLKAVLLAAGLGLLACIGLAALLLEGQTVPLLVASHIDARRVHLAERGRPPAAAQRTGPLAALPAPPALLLNPAAVHFDRHDGPARPTPHTIYVVNVSPAPVTIRAITITGADRAAFAEADTCTHSTIGVYGKCTISVHVAPMAGGGPRTATLVITANAPGSPQRVPLST